MTGFDDAIRELNQITVDLDTSGPLVAEEIDRATVTYAHLIEANAKRIVPVDTGATRNSIGTDLERDGAGRGYGVRATIGAQTSWAPYLEYGTSRMAPRAFLGPSLDRYSGDWQDACERAAVPEGFR